MGVGPRASGTIMGHYPLTEVVFQGKQMKSDLVVREVVADSPVSPVSMLKKIFVYAVERCSIVSRNET